ncbi:hypothetical protein GCM10011579_059750 [Streptomyces albiflavescens]|uniref:Uncharacterized protein n=1 Tax=Streptomyces albiflavescens TaxID=1623582 RepID=A0A917Y8D0_9ACTN|nr:hypothetical protein [Streptomyces albiflavescens]GGN77474.1 hypothetical protein GCM10011579_059750 [Streptomyces albiflavescens]
MTDPAMKLITNEKLLPFWEKVTWSAVENAVMFDEVDLDSLSDEEVVLEALSLHLDYLDIDPGEELDVSKKTEKASQVQWSSNHEQDLKSQGDKFLGEGKHEFAILFYATWIEHWLNRIILLRATGKGMHPELATALIRSSRIELKMGRIWTSLGNRSFPKELARQVTRVMESRNAFVHYKWPSEDDETHSESINRTKLEAQKAQQTITDLIELEDSIFYKGRSKAIREAFRKGWYERRRETLNQATSSGAEQAND